MTESEVRRHLDRVRTIVENLGADVQPPIVGRLPNGELAFDFVAHLPGPPPPIAPEIRLGEIWSPTGDDEFRVSEYRYEFIERPLNRRLGFHRHDEGLFLDQHAVAVHEHCEEVLGLPECEHHYGLPIDAYEAIHAFTVLWGQPGPIGCAERKCMD